VPVRTFKDSAGATWEVFEVRRSSNRPGAVSAGHEQGWLAFMSGLTKRRLAPYPAEWAASSDAQLETLCASALSAPAPRYPSALSSGEFPVLDGEHREPLPPPSDDPVERTVREFAHQARMTGLPAIEAMVQLKALLVSQAGDGAPVDLHRVRRWFVEAYYFESDA
jgi:hypothetical protein